MPDLILTLTFLYGRIRLLQKRTGFLLALYAKDAAMQAMLSDNNGRVLIIEPGIGYRLEKNVF